MSDTLKERKIYRILTNASTKAWDKIAFWTTAKSVDAADGSNLETKVGAIKGITTSTSTTTKGYAADATVIKTLNDSLGMKLRINNGTPEWSARGADTWSPFKKNSNADLKVLWLDYRRLPTTTTDGAYYTIDVKSKISCYNKLNINNFWFQYVNGGTACTVGNFYTTVSGSIKYCNENVVTNIGTYDSSTGILSVKYTMSSPTTCELCVIAVYLEE